MRIPRTPKGPRSLVAAFVVTLLAGAVMGFGLLAGWFSQGDIRGTTEGFDETAIDPGDDHPESWPEYGLNPQRTRANTEIAGMRPPFRRVWKVDAGSLVEFPPVVADGRVFFGTNRRIATSVDLKTGRILWRRRLDGVVASSPAIDTHAKGNRVLFTTMNGDLLSLRVDNGRGQRRLRLNSPMESSPLVVGSSAYVGTKDGRIVAVDLNTFQPRWTTRVDGEVKASLARSGPNVIAVDYAGIITALRIRDGSKVWRTVSPGERFRGAGRFYAGPAVAYGRVFVGNVNGRMLGLSAATGRINWMKAVDDYIYSSPAVANRTVYFGSYDHHLYALDAVTGQVRWRRNLGQRISGSPTVIGNLVWIPTLTRQPRNGVTIAMNASTGREVFRFPDGRYATPIAVDGYLVHTGVRTVYGMRPRNAR